MKLRRNRFVEALAVLLVFVLAGLSEARAAENAAASAREPASLTNLVIDLGNGVTMDFVLIPPGSFLMGSSSSPLLDQKPPHRVTLDQPFYLGRYEVTQEQWQAVMSNTPSIHKGPQYPDCARHPVENVSWRYCQEFLARLSQRVGGYEFRLPTEAEWEYACRAGTTNSFSFGAGQAEADRFAWFSANAEGRTHPIGGKAPNAWGLHDMHGNVWEWCSDLYRAYPGGMLPNNVGSGTSRVLRGGAFNSLPGRLESSYRHELEPDDCARYYGFRCVAIRHPIPK